MMMISRSLFSPAVPGAPATRRSAWGRASANDTSANDASANDASTASAAECSTRMHALTSNRSTGAEWISAMRCEAANDHRLACALTDGCSGDGCSGLHEIPGFVVILNRGVLQEGIDSLSVQPRVSLRTRYETIQEVTLDFWPFGFRELGILHIAKLPRRLAQKLVLLRWIECDLFDSRVGAFPWNE
jgi:hypothetical protein